VARHLVRRTVSALITLLVVALVSFTLIHLTPGDPVAIALGEAATAEQITETRERLGLNDPLPVQFARWFGRFLTRFDLGISLQLNQPVGHALASRAEPTLLLAGLGFILAVGLGVPSGVVAAVHHSRLADQLIMMVATLGMTVPAFILGIGLILAFSVELGWFPVAGYIPMSEDFGATLRSILLPAVALGLAEAALIARITRSSVIEVLREDFVRTARAKGLSEARVIYGHALRSALIPILTVVGLTVARLLGGTVVLEEVFGLPGMGQLVVNAIRRRDYPVIQAAILLVGVVYMLINLIVDIAYGLVDPRVRYE
jgi:peptide/nickel transport system permease protein